jgi:cellulose synthase/poly-beta-1,6-N-acetylglucosamine synthase-like glycosyltransferase
MRRTALAVAGLAFAAVLLAGLHAWRLAALAVNAAVLVHLIFVSLRRVALTLAALFGRDRAAPPPAEPPPRLAALVPCRNEAGALPATLAAWDAVEYPRERLRLALIDDASGDATPKLLAEFAATRPWATVVRRDGPAVGKGAALQAGLAAAADAEAVAVFDADARPAPDCLRWLAAPLGEPTIAAVAGRMIPDDDARPAASYAALEAAVHQRLTMTGAARLNLTTALLGSAYLVRRPLLDELGFDPTHRLEDIDLTMRLHARGGRIAWAPAARCFHRPPADRRAFLAQRTAWSRGFHRVARRWMWEAINAAPSGLSALDRALFCLGYLDRLSFLLGCGLAMAARFAPALWMPWPFLAIVAAVPLAQLPLAMAADHWPRRRMARAVPALALFALDLAAELSALAADFAGRPLRWRRARRAGEERLG